MNFERFFVAAMVWLVFAGIGAVVVGIIHLLVSLMFWDMIPLKQAIPLMRLMGGAALIPAMLAAAFYQPDRRA